MRTPPKADIDKLAELRDKLRQARDAYWAEQVDIQWQVANAWVLHAEGKHEDALKALAARSRRRGQDGKAPHHARDRSRPRASCTASCCSTAAWRKEALAAFEATLKKEPNRLAAYVGAAKAAKRAGAVAKAKQYTAKVVALTRDADTKRPEVSELASKTAAAAGVR